MRYLILVAVFTAAAMLPFTGWVLGRASATPIVYLPAASSCLSSWGV